MPLTTANLAKWLILAESPLLTYAHTPMYAPLPVLNRARFLSRKWAFFIDLRRDIFVSKIVVGAGAGARDFTLA